MVDKNYSVLRGPSRLTVLGIKTLLAPIRSDPVKIRIRSDPIRYQLYWPITVLTFTRWEQFWYQSIGLSEIC